MSTPIMTGTRPPDAKKGRKRGGSSEKHKKVMRELRSKDLAHRQEQAEVRAEILERLGL